MTQSRRDFLMSGAAIAGGVVMLPYAVQAGGHAANEFKVPGGVMSVHPVAHATKNSACKIQSRYREKHYQIPHLSLLCASA